MITPKTMHKGTVSYILDPRFPGGTSSAVAAELQVMRKCSHVSHIEVHAISSSMFGNKRTAPQLQAALTELGIELIWNARTIAGDVVIFHNPSCLRFQEKLSARIVARRLIVVEHENFLQPTGQDAYDVEKCHAMIRDASVTLQRCIAPISAWNRDTIARWQAMNGSLDGWDTLPEDWFNICAFEMIAPTQTPRDRRGRHSRPGLEKFPRPEVLELCFPEHAEENLILGADALMTEDDHPPHWTLVPFRGMKVDDYLSEIDFLVYYTSPGFRESFGRVIAEGIAAGKIVITDPETAKTFGGGAVAAEPSEVDAIIANYVANPEFYVRDVEAAQAALTDFSPEAFLARIGPMLTHVQSHGVAA